jgi:hypothetical protein
MGNGYTAATAVYETSWLRDREGRVVSANRTFSQGGVHDKAWRGYRYRESGALSGVMEVANTVSTSGLSPTEATWTQVRWARLESWLLPGVNYTVGANWIDRWVAGGVWR